jgi:anion-transporting  ArsA/GET3 family ATPase
VGRTPTGRPQGGASRPRYVPLVPSLLERRLIFVTGKGGVGKSTVAIALGLLAARHGRRTIVAELAGGQRAQRALDAEPVEPFVEAELAPGLFTISIDPQHAMEEYLRLKVGALGHAMSSSRLFNAFAMATPGMRELLSIGKVWELAQFERRSHHAHPYDLVVVDAPATGHGVGTLRTPRTFAEIARVGPIAHQANQIATTIADPEFTAIIAVSTAEEMPVNETIALHEALTDDGLALEAVVVNARYPDRFSDSDATQLEALLAAPNGSHPDPGLRAALRAALSERERAAAQAEQQRRLETAVPVPIATLPFVFSPALGSEELDELSAVLEATLP